MVFYMGDDPGCAWFVLQFFYSFSARSRPSLDPRSVRYLLARPGACKKTMKKPYENGAKTVLGTESPFGRWVGGRFFDSFFGSC